MDVSNNEITGKKPTMYRKFMTIVKEITVEPVALLMLTGAMLASTATQTLALDKTCRVNMQLSDEICDILRHQESDEMAEYERIVQAHVANLLAYRSIIMSVLPCILFIFAGGWMDLTGYRKPLMILTVLGEILVQISNILNVVFFYQLKVEYLIFIDAVAGSIFGGWNIMFLAIFSYIADVTTEETRTYRVGLVSVCVYVGMPIGMSLSGYLLNSFGYITVYVIALILASINISYLIFVLSDPERTKEHKMHDNRGFVYFLKIFFNPNHLVKSVKTVFRKTGDNRPVLLCLYIVITCFLFIPMQGESSILLMSVRYRFNWNEVQFSMFQTFNLILNMIGIIFSILVISKKLGWHDSVLGIISTSSKIAGAFVYCFAAVGWVFYFGPVMDILNGTAVIAIRSIVSKSVEPYELAKMNSIIGISEVLIPLAGVPLYTQVYTATLEVLPGAVFLMGAGLTIPPLALYIWLFYRHRKSIGNQISDSEKSTTKL